jgi:hypothetical protein
MALLSNHVVLYYRFEVENNILHIITQSHCGERVTSVLIKQINNVKTDGISSVVLELKDGSTVLFSFETHLFAKEFVSDIINGLKSFK